MLDDCFEAPTICPEAGKVLDHRTFLSTVIARREEFQLLSFFFLSIILFIILIILF
ncbi:hypothetical protein BDV37DRAFT_249087, partial [Aspergillus pseudonomiae]